MRIIALCGPAGAGKSTVARHLVADHGFVRLRFAQPIKDMLETLGLDVRHLEGPLKAKPCGLLDGRTPRHAFTTLGTGWGREMISPDLWILHLERQLEKLEFSQGVVVDDLRFPNEYARLRAYGAEVWVVFGRRAARRGWLDALLHPPHASERHWHRFDADAHVHNPPHQTMLRLTEEVDALLLDEGCWHASRDRHPITWRDRRGLR